MKAKTAKRSQGASLLRRRNASVVVEKPRMVRSDGQAIDQASQNSYVVL